MSYRFRSICAGLTPALCAFAGLFLLAGPVRGQNLALNPGLASAYAGTGQVTSSTYTGPLSGLALNSPRTLAYDAKGNLFLADQYVVGTNTYYEIRVVASGNGPIQSAPTAGSNPKAGWVYPVAGSGTASSCATGNSVGDGCPATQALILGLTGMAVDSQGNVYLTDSNANEVRVIYAQGPVPGLKGLQAGYIYAVAGNGTDGYSGDGGPAVQAELSGPNGVGVDSNGNVYLADSGNDVVRVVYAKGAIPGLPDGATAGDIYTIAGTAGMTCSVSTNPCGDGDAATDAQFSYGLGGIAIDPSGNIYISDSNDYRVRAIFVGGTLPGISSPTLGYIYTVAGSGNYNGLPRVQGLGGQATVFTLNDPLSLAFDAAGALYIIDEVSYQVFRVDPSGVITSVFGNAPINQLTGSSILCTTAEGATDAYGDGCPTDAATLSSPQGLAVDPAGNIYIADFGNNLVREAVVSSSAVLFTGVYGLPVPSQILDLYNTGTQVLQLSNIAIASPFTVVATGGPADCGNSTSLEPGASCQIGIGLTPPQAGTLTGALHVSSNAIDAASGENTASLSATIVQAASSATLAVSPAVPAQASPGQPVTFTATVVPQAGVTFVPTGTVNFNNGSTLLGKGTLDSSGVATFTSTALSPGKYVVTAAYAGDTNFNSSASNTVFTTVASSAVPTVTLTASPTSATVGQSVTLTATVTQSSGTPTGTIAFEDGIAPISSAIPLSGGSATFSTTSLPAGSNTLYAVYSGNLPGNGSNPVLVTVAANAQLLFTPGVISTIAGNYNFGYEGDGGAATSAQLSNAGGMAYDSAGNLYVADGGNNVIRVVASGKKGTIPGIADTQQGFIYTVAGVAGQACATPPCRDGGQANQAFLNDPASVAVDLAGNLYIADSGDYVIREVAPNGTISTVAGMFQSSGNSGDGGPATQATFGGIGNPTNGPQSVAVDHSGNLYIADTTNNVIRKVDAQTQIITTVVGSFAAQAAGVLYSGDGGPATLAALQDPRDIAFDAQGNLYIADTTNNVVREVSAQTGIISTVAGHYYAQIGENTCGNNPALCFAGDGGPATQAAFNFPTTIRIDTAGNLYIADSGNYVVRMVDAQTGTINTIAGQGTQQCSSSVGPPCGEGGLATGATFDDPFGLALDSSGNLVVSDPSDSVVRQITAGSTAIDFGSNNYLGTIVGQPVTVTNSGSQPLAITGITASDGFSQAASGGADCAASTTLAPAQQCTINVQFFPTAAKAYTGTLTVASNSSNAQNGNNTITLTGTGLANGGNQPQTISFPVPAGPFYVGMQIPLGATASSNLAVDYLVTGPGLILNNGTPTAALKITGAGAITVMAYQFGNTTYAAASNNPATVSLTVTQPTLTITALNQSIAQGQTVPAYTSASDYSVVGFIGTDSSGSLTGQPTLTVVDPATGAAIPVGTAPAAGQYTLAITQGNLTAPSYYKLVFVNGLFNVSGSDPQTVAFATPLRANLTYGAAPITLTAVANDAKTGKPDNLPITYSVSPATDSVTGNLLQIGSAGPLSVTAVQLGNAFYGSASATESAVVAKASLSVTANNQTVVQGVGLPALNSVSSYTFGPFQNQETPGVLSGAPTLTIVDGQGNPPGPTPPVGTYTIKITQGSLSSPNYAFTFANGTLTVVKGKSQTVTLPQLPTVTYGTANIALNASASSGLGVTYTVTSGPAMIVSGNQLSIQGAGTVTVTATQPGDSTYAPASATQSINVGRALLTVTAANVTRIDDTANPPLTGYSITGFLNGDQPNVVSGSPSLMTTALPGSPVGTYPVIIAQQPPSGPNGISAANYTFAFVNGTLTITPGGPAQDFSLNATPTVIGIPQGQLRETTIALLPVNYYQGTVKLSCSGLPANMTCVFSPSALNPDGSGNTVTGTLTINTNASSTVVATLVPPPGRNVFPAMAFFLPGELAALAVALYRRKRWKKSRTWQLLILLISLHGAIGIVACGGSATKSGSQYTAPGSYTVQVSATDSTGGASHSIKLAVDVQ